MPVYLVQRTDRDPTPFDGFYSFVCVAGSEREARFLHPDGSKKWMPKGFRPFWSTVFNPTPRWDNGDYVVSDCWPDPRKKSGHVEVLLIGSAFGSEQARVILASNRGS